MNGFLLSLGFLLVFLAGLNLRSMGNALIFSVSVMGRHADLRRLLLNSVVFWLGTSVVVAPVLYVGWEVCSFLMGLNGFELRLAAYVTSSVLLVWGLFNLYVYKVGPRRDSEGRLRVRIVKLSRSVGKFEEDFVFGVFNGLSVLASELGLFLGGIWLMQKGGGFGFLELGVVLLSATILIWVGFLFLSYGYKLSDLEKFRKRHGSKVSFLCGVLGVLGSWVILANSMGLI
jgi:hypothetical protein